MEAVVKAISATKVSVNINAVEKNRAALPSLRARASRWASSGCKVDIVHAELLRFKSTNKVDIVVCELFGSFGSDMLAPEYLDAVQTNLKGKFRAFRIDAIRMRCCADSYLQGFVRRLIDSFSVEM